MIWTDENEMELNEIENQIRSIKGTPSEDIPAERTIRNAEPEGFLGVPLFSNQGEAPMMPFAQGAADTAWNMGQGVSTSLFGTPYNPVKSNEGALYELGSLGMNALPFMRGAHVATLPARLATAAGSSYLFNPENPVEATKEGLGWAAGAEAIPYVGKALRQGVDKFVRKDLAKDMISNMTKHFNESKELAMSYLNPLLQKFGNEDLSEEAIKSIQNLYESNKDYLGRDAQKVYDRFLETPNLENAQKFQSQLSSSIRNIKGDDVASRNAIESYIDLREGVLDQMSTFFSSKSPTAAQDYDMFRGIYSKEVGPYLNNKTLNKAVHGETSKIGPQKLSTALTESTEGVRSRVNPEHLISELAPEMAAKLSRSSLYQSGLGAGLGTLVGGPSGGIIGAAVPQAIKYAGGDLANLVLNDEMTRILSTLSPSIQRLILGNAIAPENKFRYEEK